jgi:hypothetical protein
LIAVASERLSDGLTHGLSRHNVDFPDHESTSDATGLIVKNGQSMTDFHDTLQAPW